MQAKKERRHSIGNILMGVFALVCAVVFVVCAYKIASYFMEEKQATESYDLLREQITHPMGGPYVTGPGTTNPDGTPVNGAVSGNSGFAVNVGEGDTGSAAEVETAVEGQLVSIDFSKLRESAPDIVAWLYCEDTDIDYPVLQTDDNDYYLTHLYNGEYNSNGSIFMDYRNGSISEDKNVVVYGHNMRNGTMFNALMDYKDQSFYEAHPNMVLFTPEGDYLVELIAGTIEDGYSKFMQFDFTDDAAFAEYVAQQRAASTFDSEVELLPEDRIISLCTCSYENNNGRYLLIGKLTPILSTEAS